MTYEIEQNFTKNQATSIRSSIIHFSRNSMKCSLNAKNEKCIAGYMPALFSHFAPRGGIFMERQNDFIFYFFVDMKFE